MIITTLNIQHKVTWTVRLTIIPITIGFTNTPWSPITTICDTFIVLCTIPVKGEKTMIFITGLTFNYDEGGLD